VSKLKEVLVVDTQRTTGGLDLAFIFEDGAQGVPFRAGESSSSVANKLHTLSQIIKRAHGGEE
jgi:hypothetical protein